MAKRKNAGLFSKRKTKKVRGQGTDAYIRELAARSRRTKAARRARKNPPKITATKISGWVPARAVKIVRNKRGQAVAVRIQT